MGCEFQRWPETTIRFQPKQTDRFVLGWVTLASFLVAGCSVDASGVAAGESILDDLPALQPVPVFELGGIEASRYEAFSSVPPLAVSEDGTLWALDRTTNEVWRYDSTGAFVLAFGGRGEGPGEFENPLNIGLVGDTVWVRNMSPPFVTLFSPDGNALRREVVEDWAVSRVGVPEGPEAMLAGGASFSTAIVPWGEPAGVHEVALTVSSAEGAVDTLSFTRFPNAFTYPSGGFTRGGYWDLRPALHAVAPDGSGVVVAEWEEVLTGNVTLTRFGPDAEPQWKDTLHLDPVPLDGDVADSIIAVAAGYVRDAVERREQSDPGSTSSWPGDAETIARDELALQAVYPPIRSLLVALDGRIWLERPLAPNRSEWIVLDSARTPAFRVTFPPGHELSAASLTSAWTTHTDTLDVPYVTRYALDGVVPQAR